MSALEVQERLSQSLSVKAKGRGYTMIGERGKVAVHYLHGICFKRNLNAPEPQVMYGHTYSKLAGQGKLIFPCPRSRLIF